MRRPLIHARHLTGNGRVSIMSLAGDPSPLPVRAVAERFAAASAAGYHAFWSDDDSG